MLDKEKTREYNNRVNGLVAQLGAHHIRIVGVEGSNPFKSTKRKTTHTGGFSFWYGIHAEGIRKFNCSSPGDCCLRRLDGAKLPFSQSENANESLQVHQKKRQHPQGGCRVFCSLLFSLFPLLSSLQAVVSEKGIPLGDELKFVFVLIASMNTAKGRSDRS